MGKRILALILLTVTGVSGLYSQWLNINIDKKTIAEVEKNTASQEAANQLQNIQVDSIKQKQSKLLTLVETIALNKDLLIQTYGSVKGFKQESKYYSMIASTGMDIINHSSIAIEAINKSKIEGKAVAALNISNLVTKAIGLGKAFADIVANSEVPNPIKHPDATSGNKDKYNLLNRHERIRMANDILLRLRSIDSEICILAHYANTSKALDILFHIDRESYITYIMTNVRINDLIYKWNRATK